MARYIDVGKLLKELTTSFDGTKIPDVDCDNFPVKIDLRLLRRIILRQPTADVVEVKHGEWEEREYGMFFACSNCEYIVEYQLTNYCPYCGAKMDGGKTEC